MLHVATLLVFWHVCAAWIIKEWTPLVPNNTNRDAIADAVHCAPLQIQIFEKNEQPSSYPLSVIRSPSLFFWFCQSFYTYRKTAFFCSLSTFHFFNKYLNSGNSDRSHVRSSLRLTDAFLVSNTNLISDVIEKCATWKFSENDVINILISVLHEGLLGKIRSYFRRAKRNFGSKFSKRF